MRHVDRLAEYRAQDPGQGRSRLAAASSSCGDCVMSAALWALTAENSSGCAKANRSAPYPPIEIPLMARARTARVESRYLPFDVGQELLQEKVAVTTDPSAELM